MTGAKSAERTRKPSAHRVVLALTQRVNQLADENNEMQAFANALANQSAGHTNLLAVVSPNIPAKPATVLITKVTMKGSKQVMQMFGPAQAAVARAVVDSVVEGVLPKAEAENWVIVCGVFIAGSANDYKKIYKNNYEATKLAIKNAMKASPSIDEIIAKKETKHPFE